MFEVSSCDMHDYCSQVHYRNNISIVVLRLDMDLARFVLLGRCYTQENVRCYVKLSIVCPMAPSHSQSFPLMHKNPPL